MKSLALFFILFVSMGKLIGQQNYIDSLKYELQITQNDTLRLVLLTRLGGKYYYNSKYDSSLFFSQQQMQIAQKLNYKIDEAYALDIVGSCMFQLNYSRSLETLLKGEKIAEDIRSEKNILPQKYLDLIVYFDSMFISKDRWSPRLLRLGILSVLYVDVGVFYGFTMENRRRQLFYVSKGINILESLKDTFRLASACSDQANTYRLLGQLDSSLLYAQKVYDLLRQKVNKRELDFALATLGTIHFQKGNYSLAMDYLRQAIQPADIKYHTPYGLGYAYLALSKFFLRQGVTDSSLYYAKKTFEIAQQTNQFFLMPDVCDALARLYRLTNNTDSAFKYFELSLALKDSSYRSEKIRQLQVQDFDEQMHQQEVEVAKSEYKSQVKIYALLTGLGITLLLALILLHNNRQRKRTNTLLQKQKEEIQSTLTELKSTQAQLIQSEKMASLGELTAGIAHEIQNPLNFVNNFSEVNKELIEELRQEKNKGNNGKIEDEILNDMEQNLEKVIHHGKRADAIVKGMLQHSRVSTGQKELTDINKLADEYLRLSYHGLRAKDKSFNAKLETNFDYSLGKINVVPQDIGRVLLNLFNNAFYACTERSRSAGMQKNVSTSSAGQQYEPIVSVCTKLSPLPGGLRGAEIHVKDNGNGIPQKIIDKIFQPFFTTKPTGQGTGLGLSLSYDIVKAHGGEIKVKTKEGEGAEFVIQLPIV
jgi:two-component system NtrC family sensor kinase